MNIHTFLRYGIAGYIFLLVVLLFCYFGEIYVSNTIKEILLSPGSSLLIIFSGFPLGALFYWLYMGIDKSFGGDIETKILTYIHKRFDIEISDDIPGHERRRILDIFLQAVKDYVIWDDKKPDHKDRIYFNFSQLHSLGSCITALISAVFVNWLILEYYITVKPIVRNLIYPEEYKKYFLYFVFAVIAIGSLVTILIIYRYRRRVKNYLIMYQLDYLYKRKKLIQENIKEIGDIENKNGKLIITQGIIHALNVLNKKSVR